MTIQDCKYYAFKLLMYGTLFCHLTITDASITWTLPPPQRGPLQTSDGTNRRTIQQVIKGSFKAHLTWNFTFSGEIFQRVEFEIDNVQIGEKTSSGIVSIEPTRNFREHFDISRSDPATLIIYNVTEADEAVFTCSVRTDIKTWGDEIRVKIGVPSNLTTVSNYNQTVVEGTNITLLCTATGEPLPNITWTKVLGNGGNGEVLHKGKFWNFPNINRTVSGKYRCTASNGFGNPVSHKVEVTVLYPAKIVKLVSERNVTAQTSIPLDCRAEGNPPPSYTWTPCESVCNESVLNFQASNNSIYVFTCEVENKLGSDTRNTTLFIASDLINVTLVIMVEDCTAEEYDQLWEKLSKMIDEIFADKLGYKSVQRKSIRCGSVIVDLALKFSSTVRESQVLSILRDAAKNGEFGDFNVSAIAGTRDPGITTTMATTPTSSSDSTMWIIVGVVLGVACLLVVVGVVAWCVYKKRKCKKRDSKEVHNNGPQGEAGGNVKNEGYVEVNRGYEGGNRSSVPPVVYDTAQTGNRGAVQGPPQYAVVDKSKRNPKKKKPGELQYAELAEFSAGQGGPRSSTSPTNRPTEIQYADVNAM